MDSLPGEVRVAIVGGGVIGLAVAHHLASMGESDVLLLERENMLGAGSSGASAGGLRQQFGDEANILYAMEGVRQIRALHGETGFDPEFREHGYLLLAGTDERLAALTRNVALQNWLGLPSEILTPEEVRRRFPVLRTDDIAGAAFCGTDGYCDPHAIVQAFAAEARRKGVRIEPGVEVAGFVIEDGAVLGVETTRGATRAENVVLAAGPRAGDVAALAGLNLPLRPCRRQIFSTHPVAVPVTLPLVIDLDRPFYFRPESGGVLFSAAEVEETRDFDTSLDDSHLEKVVQRAIHRCPMLADATISGGWAGIRTLTPDGLAILGDVPRLPGLILAVGMSGHGITHAPAVGRALAARILRGESGDLPLGPFRVDRFEAGTEFPEDAAEGSLPPG